MKASGTQGGDYTGGILVWDTHYRFAHYLAEGSNVAIWRAKPRRTRNAHGPGLDIGPRSRHTPIGFSALIV